MGGGADKGKGYAMSSENDEELLDQILSELRALRTIPSTALRLRAASVEDSVAYIRSDSRFQSASVVHHNPQALRIALRAAPAWEGMVAEFGVHTGRTLEIIAAHFPELVVHGFDSFRGLPEGWTGSREDAGAFDVGGAPPTMTASNVEFHIGWFADTVPAFAAATSLPFRFAHLDADLYSSSSTVLTTLADRFVDGTVVVFDEYFGYHGWPHHEHKAFTELLEARSLTFEAIAIGHMSLGVRLVAS
jgi:hypothetical protein